MFLMQVTIEYLRDGGHLEPLRVHTLLISTQHNPDISCEELQQELMEHVVKPVIPPNLLTEHTQYFLNPSKRCGGVQGVGVGLVVLGGGQG
jgi:S-adenosylmethionine synthetase